MCVQPDFQRSGRNARRSFEVPTTAGLETCFGQTVPFDAGNQPTKFQDSKRAPGRPYSAPHGGPCRVLLPSLLDFTHVTELSHPTQATAIYPHGRHAELSGWVSLFMLPTFHAVGQLTFHSGPSDGPVCNNLAETTARHATSRRPSGLRKTKHSTNSLAHRTTWLRSDLAGFPYLCCRPSMP